MNRRRFAQMIAASPALVASGAQTMADLLATIITIKPNDPRIHYYGFANLRVSSREAVSDRMIPDSHYRTDNPAALIKFETDASEVSIVLNYARVDSIPGRTSWAGDGLVSVEFSNSVQIGRAKGSSGPQISKIKMGEVTRRTIEVMLPYGDTVSFLGIGLPKGAELYQIKQEMLPRYVAYGDSITQGFRATNPVETYAVRLSRAKKWELFNMGFGSRRATIPDGAVLARLKPDVVTMMIGVNDCLDGKPVARYATDVTGLITEFRRTMRTTPVFFITPLPVAEPAKWRNSEKLDAYRTAATQALTGLNDANLHIIDGTTLITPNPTLFADGLHPNATGFEAIAKNLEQAITL
jgi:lysophospholipase L1-like esterase